MLRSDLPLDRDASRIFLPAIIGFMVFLAAVALAASMGLDNMLARWRGEIDSAFTVELPRPDAESAVEAAARRQAALAAVAAVPGVASATLLDTADQARLLAPWLGPGADTLDLPLPDLVNVAAAPGAAIDIAALKEKLATSAPGAVVDDHGRWRAAIAGIGRTARLAALGLLLLVASAAALTVVFVSRAGLAAHRRVIEILHLIGAHDGYIAGQFQRHALQRALLGAVAGMVAAALVFESGRRLLPGLAEAGFALHPLQWAWLALLAPAAALLAMATARYTVLGALDKMM
jgi:cell division transport system permease protein